MRHKRNETRQLLWIATHGVFIRSDHSSNCRAARAHESRCFLGHVITKQCCEIQSVGVFDLKRRCTEWSVCKTSKYRESRLKGFICSLIALAVLWCLTLTILCGAALSRTHLMWEHKPNSLSQKAFQNAHRHYLPWIYCSNTHCTMVLWQKCGIFPLNVITGVMVYNYSMYVWLRQL